jgi:hypothetical protein
MNPRQACTWLLFLSAAAALCGCPANPGNSVATPENSALFYAAKAQSGPDLSRSQAAMKRASRESPLSQYHNPDYGISFRYPRNYALEEGDIQEHSYFLKRQEQLDLEQPGAQLLVTLLIPEDGYPNTTFVHGSLQLVANQTHSQESCLETPGPNEQETRAIRPLGIEGLRFGGLETRSVTAGTQILERDYAALSNGTCYELYLVVAVDEPSNDNDLKPADSGKIMRLLEKIVSSLQFHLRRAAPSIDPAAARSGLGIEVRPALP